MGWGAIPDDHPLMAGMVGLQTAHRYGNATLLASDFVLGIGNRWANRHTGSVEVYTKGRKFVHVDIEPTQIGRVFGRTTGSSRTRRPRSSCSSSSPTNGRQPATQGLERVGRGMPRTQAHAAPQDHFDNVPIKPQRVYQEMSTLRSGRDTCYVSTIGLSQIAAAQFLHVTSRVIGSTAARLVRSDGPSPPRSAYARRTPTARSSRSPATTTSSS